MTIFLVNLHYYFVLLVISSYPLIFTAANNDIDHHSNDKIEKFNSTYISPTTLDNISTDDTLIDNNTNISALFDDVSLFSTFVTSFLHTTSIPSEITDISVNESHTTFEGNNDFTTDLAHVNSTSIYEEKTEEQTTAVSKVPCELSKYGCCTDGITERSGIKIHENIF